MSRNAAWSVWPSRGRHSHTIFLMLGLLKLPALRCFWTWLAEPCRARPLVGTGALGDSSTFSLSTPAERQHTPRKLLRDRDRHVSEKERFSKKTLRWKDLECLPNDAVLF